MAKLAHVLITTLSFMLSSSSEVLLVKTMNNKFNVSCRASEHFLFMPLWSVRIDQLWTM